MASSKRRPMRRLEAKTVLRGLVTAWRLAGVPTRREPSSRNATVEGVVRPLGVRGGEGRKRVGEIK